MELLEAMALVSHNDTVAPCDPLAPRRRQIRGL